MISNTADIAKAPLHSCVSAPNVFLCVLVGFLQFPLSAQIFPAQKKPFELILARKCWPSELSCGATLSVNSPEIKTDHRWSQHNRTILCKALTLEYRQWAGRPSTPGKEDCRCAKRLPPRKAERLNPALSPATSWNMFSKYTVKNKNMDWTKPFFSGSQWSAPSPVLSTAGVLDAMKAEGIMHKAHLSSSHSSLWNTLILEFPMCKAGCLQKNKRHAFNSVKRTPPY